MTGNNWLDWVILTFSLFNTILLVWLGMTVQLNAEKRTWGVWLGAAGLFVGAAFFVSHTALVSQPLFPLSDSTDFWWHAGWGPVIFAPFSWYVIVLWYAGYWDDQRAGLHNRHHFWMVVMMVITVLLVGLLLFGNPLPTVASLGKFLSDPIPSVAGIPLLIVVYPVYILLCIGLALDALLRPGPSGRLMGDQARGRARPWLIGTSITLMGVCLLVGWVMIWLYTLLQTPISWEMISGPVILSLARFDGVISVLISLAILLLGQAIVSYEIFTGRTLPRRGFLRQWQNAVLLAAYVSCVVAGSLIFHVRPVYSLLLTVLLMTVSYALFSWRAGAEREQLTSRLRPFVTSQRLFDRLLDDGTAGAEPGMQASFDALCRDILDVKQACLVALGPLAPLAGPPLIYPPGTVFSMPDLADITAQVRTPQKIGLQLNQQQYPGLSWAVSLWSERGLIGVLLMGEKCDGGFYAEEEILIARASGERFIDNAASAEIARRLMALQRQRLVESQVLDRQTRRVLHDDVLPLLHATLLQLSSSGAGSHDSQETGEAIDSLSKAHRQISDLLHDMPFTNPPEIARLGLVEALHHLILDEFGQAFDQTCWKVDEEAGQRAIHISALRAQVLYYAAREAVRNAARYARPGSRTAVLSLHLSLLWKDGLIVEIEDNGGSLAEAPAQGNGHGQGLALHSTMMAVAGGTLSIESQPGIFTRVLLKLPASDC
jgi:signal transduction histidine kinase